MTLYQKLYRLLSQAKLAEESGNLGLAHYLKELIAETIQSINEYEWAEKNK